MNDPSTETKIRLAKTIASTLQKNGFEALFAGGCVRDMLMGNQTADIDIATSAPPEKVISLFKKTVPVGAKFGVIIVIVEGIAFEVATFRSDSSTSDGRRPDSVVFTNAKEDALRRDFTINGMFLDPLTDQIHDYVGGRVDLEKRVIRAIGTPSKRFEEDYLRLLRAIRFAARFAFKIDRQTLKSIGRCAAGITRISQERIFQELTKMFAGPHPDRALELLRSSGLMAFVLPEVAAMTGVEQPEEFHPEGDVFRHTVLVLSHLREPSKELAWAAVLHDIGKPRTMTREDRIRFNNHHRVGARMATNLLKRLKASNALIDDVEAIVDNHMNFANVTKMRIGKLKTFLARPTFELEMEMHRADCLASHGLLENYHFLMAKSREFQKEQLQPAPLLAGKDLLELGLRPGPLFGTILGKAYELQLDDQLETREAALEWVRTEFGAEVKAGRQV